MRRIQYIMAIMMVLLPVSMYAEKEKTYLPDIDVKDEKIVKDGGNVNLSMTIDFSRMRIATQHTVSLVPVLKSRDGSHEYAFPPVVIDGKTRNLIYMRSGTMQTVEAPVYHDGEAKVIIRRRNRTGQSYGYSASVPYARWMLNGYVELREEVHGCVNCAAGTSSAPMMDDSSILPEFFPDYSISAIEPQPEPVKVRAENRSARLQFLVDKYDILPNYRNNRAELNEIRTSIDLVRQNHDLEIIGIYITGYASPEGTMAHNMALSENRAKALAEYIIKNDDIDRQLIHVDWKGEDWEGLKVALDQYPQLLGREKIISIIDEASGEDYDYTESLFRKLQPADIYTRLVNEVYAHLRRNDYRIEYNVRNFNVEEARKLMYSRPELLSLSEIYKVAGASGKGSEEYAYAMQVAARMFPGEPAVVNDMAMDAISYGDYAEAIRLIENASCTRDPQLVNTLGVAYAGAGDPFRAEAAFVESAEAGCENAWKNLVEVRGVIDQLE